MGDRKSRFLTYLISLIGGLFGLHHLYLGRTQHALLWATTCGGFFVGFIYEFIFLLPKYIGEANQDRAVAHEYLFSIFKKKSPAFEASRFCGQYLTALFYGFLTFHAFPEHWQKSNFFSIFVSFFTALAIALGAQLVGTIGPRRCSFVWPLLGALSGAPFCLSFWNMTPSFNPSILLSCLFFQWKVEWNPDYFRNLAELKLNRQHQPENSSEIFKSPQWASYVYYCIGAIVFAMIFSASVYQNLQVDMNGQRVKIQDVLTDFVKAQEFSQFFRQISDILQEIWQFYKQYGFQGLWKQIWMILDSESEKQAYFVLGLNFDATQKTIESQCRKLSRQWHPDRYRDPVEKQKAEQTFVNVQQACNRLSDERKRRQSINTSKRDNPS